MYEFGWTMSDISTLSSPRTLKDVTVKANHIEYLLCTQSLEASYIRGGESFPLTGVVDP